MTIKILKKYNIFKKQKLISLKLLKTQGLCNTNYILNTSKNSYIIRVFNDDNSINRKDEYNIQQIAYHKTIAAKPTFIHKNEFMVYKFLKGKHKKILEKNDIKFLSKSIKKLHNIKYDIKTFDLQNDLIYYKQNLKDKVSKQEIKVIKKEIKNLKKYKKEFAIVHHDLNHKNILFYKNKVKFIDWEYAKINDIYFDIATICIEFDLDKKQEKLFLKYYFKNKEYYKAKLKSYKIIYKNLCSLWFRLN